MDYYENIHKDSSFERVRAGIVSAREKGTRHGRPKTAANKKEEVKKLYNNGKGLNKSQKAKKLKISRASGSESSNQRIGRLHRFCCGYHLRGC